MHAAALCAAGALLASCALIGSHAIAPPPAPLATVAAAPAPVLAAPTDTHFFTLAGAQDDVVGDVQITIASQEDTLPDIARRFDVGYEEIVRANPGVDPWIPGAGRHVVVPTRFVLPNAPHEGIVINVAAMRLYYFPAHAKGEAQQVYTHPIGIGKAGWKTPEGVTHGVSHVKDPVWRPSLALRVDHRNDNGEDLPAVVPPGPDNPLGKYEFRLGWPSYLIHGTNKPYGVGMRSSHGCMRLYPEDIAVFYDLIPIGTKVTVVNQPYAFGWRDGTLYMQAYAVMEDDSRDWDKNRKRLLANLMNPKQRQKIGQRIEGANNDVDWQRVGDLAHSPRAVPVPVTGNQPGLDTVLESSMLVENTLPEGSNWDGKTGLLVDEKTFNDLVSGKSQAPPAALPNSPASAPASPAAAAEPAGTH
jgi:L,D-transpeptidase ErfK/SrfK